MRTALWALLLAPLALSAQQPPEDKAPRGCLRWSLGGVVLSDTIGELKAEHDKTKLARNDYLADGLGKAWYRLAIEGRRGKKHFVLPDGEGDDARVASIVTRWKLGRPMPVDYLTERWGEPAKPEGAFFLPLNDPDARRKENFVWDDDACDVRAVAVEVYTLARNPHPDGPAPRRLVHDYYYVIALTRLSDWQPAGSMSSPSVIMPPVVSQSAGDLAPMPEVECAVVQDWLEAEVRSDPSREIVLGQATIDLEKPTTLKYWERWEASHELPPETQELFLALEGESDVAVRIRGDCAPHPVEVVDAKDLPEPTPGKHRWLNFDELYPDAEGLWEISKVAVSPDQSTAVLMLKRTESGCFVKWSYLVLQKADGRWTEVARPPGVVMKCIS